MQKIEYLQKLKRQLRRIPKDEQQDILADYEEHFRLGTEEGKSEDDIAESLGNPSQVGKAYIMESALTSLERKEKPLRNMLRVVLAAMSLSFLNLILGIPIVVSLAAGIIGLWAGALAMALGGAAFIFYPLIQLFIPQVASYLNVSQGLFYSSAGIAVTGLGCLFGLGMYHLTKVFFNLIKRYIRMTVNIMVK